MALSKITSNSVSTSDFSFSSNLAVSGTVTTTSANVTGNLAVTGTVSMGSSFMRNRVINGDMRIDQRNAGAAVTVNAGSTKYYAVDRFDATGETTDGVYTIQQVSDAPTGFINSLKVTVTTADASIGASQSYKLSHRIEGYNVADLMLGSSSTQQFTLSFWVKSSVTGTFSVAVGNNADLSCPSNYTISQANTWEYKTITFTSPASGTWLTTNGLGLMINWSLGVGSSYKGTANTWASYPFASTGSVDLISTLNATWYITGVQLESGSVATPFERRHYGQEFVLCQRYYEVGGNYHLYSGNVTSGNIYYVAYRYAVPKRGTVTVTPVDVANSQFPAGLPTITSGSTDGFYAQKTANGTGTGYFQFSWTASSEL